MRELSGVWMQGRQANSLLAGQGTSCITNTNSEKEVQMEVIYVWQIKCKWKNRSKEVYVVGRKGKRKHLLGLLEFLLVEGKAKWPYVRAVQRRNVHENDLGRTQSKISETI